MHHYRYVAKFGLMHMMATNVCIWFDNVVKETLRNLNQKMQEQNSSLTGRTVLTGVKNEEIQQSLYPINTALSLCPYLIETFYFSKTCKLLRSHVIFENSQMD